MMRIVYGVICIRGRSRGSMDSIVSIKALKKYFPIRSTSLFGRTRWNRALDDIDLEIERGEALGIVGESGSGKTTLGKALLGLYSATEGTIEYKSVNDEDMNLSVVFQDPFSSLNPRMTIFDIVKESLESRRGGKRNEDFRSKVLDALNSVGLSEEQMFRYPHEFSGGQRQRIAIARAIVSDPLFIVFDEPTSGLDVSVQAQILNLLKELKSRSDLSYVFISHNIGVIKYICTRIAVMYRGKIVEIADNKELFDNPMHPYTEHLLSVVPEINKSQTRTLNEETGEGAESDFVATSVGCIYCSKCPIRQQICTENPPQNFTFGGSHIVACWVRGKEGS
jgi:oligopeptide transport system ATP-binding protein